MPSVQTAFRSIVVLALLLLAAGAGYWLVVRPQQKPPAPQWPNYDEYVAAFQVGVAALDGDIPQMAEEKLTKAIELIPEEPAGWANRGLLYLRSGNLDEAARDLAEAGRLAPGNPQVEQLLGLLAEREGRLDEAAAALREAVERNPHDVRSMYRLAEVLDQLHGEGSHAEYQRLMERILAEQPGNLHVLAARLRMAVRRSDRDAVRDTLAQFEQLAPGWAQRTRDGLETLKASLDGEMGKQAFPAVLAFTNLLRAEPEYPRSAGAVHPKFELSGESLHAFLKLPPLRYSPAPADKQLVFKSEPLAGAPDGAWRAATPVWLNGEGEPVVFLANDQLLQQAGALTNLAGTDNRSSGVVPLDWDNDFRTDIALAGAAGLRFYRQAENGRFVDVAGETGLDEDVLNGDYAAALAADVDLDGDLDLIAAQRSGKCLFIRNNFDGTFAALPIFDGVLGASQFAWADLDRDGAADAAMLDEFGRLRVFANERSARFAPWDAAPPDDRFLALAVTDFNDDGALDLVALRNDGAVTGLTDRSKRSQWQAIELARWEKMPAPKAGDEVRLLAADLDNNGAVDLLASSPAGSAGWLGEPGGLRVPLAALPPRILAAADLRGDGRIDLLALDENGRPLHLHNEGRRKYHWQTVRARAARDGARGDNRINSFAVGGEIELRSGEQLTRLPIDRPAVHCGLGGLERCEVVRIEWPNGSSQVEFETPADETIVAEQRLKGSCPFLFAWNGEQFEFVSDFMWSTPLGMYINAGDKGGFLQTTDWVKIAGEQLRPRDGVYELRVNANLWETHFFDQLALVAVDHPTDARMFVDERFFMEPTEPAMRLVEAPHDLAGAWDHQGRDALAELQADDGKCLDRAGRGVYQGVTNDHWVEIELGDEAPREGSLWLIARGWVHPTDSSVNYALEQGSHASPKGLSLEASDGRGDWRVVRDRIGFPAGKNKTILIRLDDLDLSGDENPLGAAAGGPSPPWPRLRLRTTMEIYWDSIRYAAGKETAPIERRALPLQSAELRFRGIVAMTQADASSPELPEYDRIVSFGQHWRDLIGYHTRFGEIGELLERVDDRYAILTSGDEIVLRFAAPPEPRAGWRRDFIWVSDGWVKDGDYNTRFGKTVLPLPAHDLKSYDVPPRALEDDPVYQRHADDWSAYHTRYVTPYLYERGLRGLPTSNRTAENR